MTTTESWLVLRIPRSPDATSMSGVLLANGAVFEAAGATIAETCDALIAQAPGVTPTLIFPLDGRHGLAGYVLDEATKRDWQFGRHLPEGLEIHVLDLKGPDAASGLSAAEATSLLESLASAMGEAWDDNELGESMGIGRQALTLCLHHFGPWHTYTWWIMSNLFQASAGTGNDRNIREACALVEYLLSRDRPATFGPEASSLIVRMDQVAQRCIGSGNGELAARVYDAAIEIARLAFGEGHEIHAGIKNRRAEVLGGA